MEEPGRPGSFRLSFKHNLLGVKMQFLGAVIRERGVTFAVVAVKKYVVNSASQAERAIRSFSPAFPGIPVVLMGQDGSGRPTYFGRRDIARFLSTISSNQIPWKRYSY
jgi:hypothetical protein